MIGNTTRGWVGTLASMFLLTIYSCSKDNNPGLEPVEEKKGIQLREDASFGNILTDKDGKSLYFFSNDAQSVSNCNGDCLAIWPVYYSADASTNLNINKEDVGEITRADGAKQSTYKGWPLYYYAGDDDADAINGDGVGNIWFVAKPDYVLMIVNNQLIGADGNHYLEDLTIGDGTTTYFTDGAARTLYAFAPDKFNTNTYTNEEFSNDGVWPIYQVETGPIPSIIPQDLIASINVFGKTQLTFKGWPLYYFGQDAQRGENKGVSVPRPGVWPVVNLNTNTAPSN